MGRYAAEQNTRSYDIEDVDQSPDREDRSSPIENAYLAAASSVDHLEEIVKNLEHRLDAVLGVEAVNVEPSALTEKSTRSHSKITNSFETLERRVNSVNQQLYQVTSRLEL